MKKYKKELILSCLATLIPVFIGLILWNKLPDTVPSHFGVNGEADAYSSKVFMVFIPSLIMLCANIFCFVVTMADKKNKAQNPKVVKLILCIMPILSILVNSFVYFSIFDITFGVSSLVFLILGITFILMGNYMPKVKQNFTIGIKIKWTLFSEENWNKTHRFAGKIWVIVGIFSVISIFLPKSVAPYTVFLFVIAALIPMFYSYLYYKKQIKEGTIDKNAKLELENFGKHTNKIAILSSLAALIIVFLVLFTGKFECTFGDSSFKIDASYCSNLTVSYEKIDSIEYRENFDIGTRTNGYGSFILNMGKFKNKEFSYYTLYSYTSCKSAVILKCDESYLAINAKTSEETKALYETLLLKTAKE